METNIVNLKSIVKDCVCIQDVSKKTGNPYTRVDLVFINDYKVSCFLNQDQRFIINNLLQGK